MDEPRLPPPVAGHRSPRAPPAPLFHAHTHFFTSCSDSRASSATARTGLGLGGSRAADFSFGFLPSAGADGGAVAKAAAEWLVRINATAASSSTACRRTGASSSPTSPSATPVPPLHPAAAHPGGPSRHRHRRAHRLRRPASVRALPRPCRGRRRRRGAGVHRDLDGVGCEEGLSFRRQSTACC
ncbi:hypothetical protein ACP70R_012568 [Stipagrostis hirtigluma subsp. patula]